MENLRLEHFKLAGFKLHTCKAINSKQKTCMKTEENNTMQKNKFVSSDGKMNNFPI